MYSGWHNPISFTTTLAIDPELVSSGLRRVLLTISPLVTSLCMGSCAHDLSIVSSSPACYACSTDVGCACCGCGDHSGCQERQAPGKQGLSLPGLM